MTFENTYLMLLYFKNKKKYMCKRSCNKRESLNRDADKIIIELENEIANDCLRCNIDSEETIDNRCYPYNKRNIIIN